MLAPWEFPVDLLKILQIGDKSLTIAIPPGQLKYAPRIADEEPQKEVAIPEAVEPITNGDGVVAMDTGLQEDWPSTDGKKDGDDLQTNTDVVEDALAETEIKVDNPQTDAGIGEQAVAETKSNGDILAKDIQERDCSPEKPASLDVIQYEFGRNLKMLNDKIIEIDGRLDPKDSKQVCAASIWKRVRAKRNNQDLGTLFDMREHFHVYKRPQVEKKRKG